MVKSGERGIACGVVHEKVLGLGHTLMDDPRDEIGGESRERMRREKEKEKER